MKYSAKLLLVAHICLLLASCEQKVSELVSPPRSDLTAPSDGRAPDAIPAASPDPVKAAGSVHNAAGGGAAVPTVEKPPYKYFEIASFEIDYAAGTGMPSRKEIESLEMTLFASSRAFESGAAPSKIAAGDRGSLVSVRLNQPAAWSRHAFSEIAMNAVCEQIVGYFKRRGLNGIWVEPKGLDEGGTGNIVTLKVLVARAGRVRSIGEGERLPPTVPEPRPTSDAASSGRPDHTARVASKEPVTPSSGGLIDHPTHRWIREHSPIREGDAFKSAEINQYLAFLNRRTWRRVDLALTAPEPETDDDRNFADDQVTADYVIRENKPWFIYAQVSNTGTRETAQWRERFGFIHNDLTGRDDVLTLEYATAGFDRSHAVTGSYESPLETGAPRRGYPPLRYRMYGSWDEFTASDVGISSLDFEGEQWGAGAELIYTCYLGRVRDNLFLDFTAGLRYQRVRVENRSLGEVGAADFLLPYAGLRLSRFVPKSSTEVAVAIEGNLANWIGTPADSSLQDLGRLDVDRDFAVLSYSMLQVFKFDTLEVPFYRSKGDYELELSLKGQTSFNHRLVPQFQTVVGGLYSVRGYPESVAAADSSIIGTLEVRNHLLRAEPIETRLRAQPAIAPSLADWDVVLKGFCDAGYVSNFRPVSLEKDSQTLVGVGIGLELQYRAHFTIRFDWGVALSSFDSEAETIRSGDNRAHLVFTFSY